MCDVAEAALALEELVLGRIRLRSLGAWDKEPGEPGEPGTGEPGSLGRSYDLDP
jgi:hypothetical protein